jgi:hypothetical protein
MSDIKVDVFEHSPNYTMGDPITPALFEEFNKQSINHAQTWVLDDDQKFDLSGFELKTFPGYELYMLSNISDTTKLRVAATIHRVLRQNVFRKIVIQDRFDVVAIVCVPQTNQATLYVRMDYLYPIKNQEEEDEEGYDRKRFIYFFKRFGMRVTVDQALLFFMTGLAMAFFTLFLVFIIEWSGRGHDLSILERERPLFCNAQLEDYRAYFKTLPVDTLTTCQASMLALDERFKQSIISVLDGEIKYHSQFMRMEETSSFKLNKLEVAKQKIINEELTVEHDKVKPLETIASELQELVAAFKKLQPTESVNPIVFIDQSMDDSTGDTPMIKDTMGG